MTPTTLQTVGRALYGPCWQREMARQLDVSARTVNRWATGVHAIPSGVQYDLEELCINHAEELWHLAKWISEGKEVGEHLEGGYYAGYSVLSQKGGGQNDAGRLK